MYRETARLILYSDLDQSSILLRLAAIFQDWEAGAPKAGLIHRIYSEVKRLLDLSTECGFDINLWQCYLAWVMATHENSFALTAERRGAADGSINQIALADFSVFRRLFFFDFGPIERDLEINCFSLLTNYRAIPKMQKTYNRDVSRCILALRAAVAGASTDSEVFDLISKHYLTHGAGIFGLNAAFRVRENNGSLAFLPINNLDDVRLSDLIGYDIQKAQLRENIEAFVSGRPFNNTLLYGDAGTGKSTSVKAILNEYRDRGLRVVEIYKHQFRLLGQLISQVKNRMYRFIIFIDDLSFDEGEVEYKYLKAVIEGGLETRPDNVMICATSNRRHLIRETWKDRDDMEHDGDVHRSDTMEEKLSLAARFGCAINYSAPDRRLFERIVKELAAKRPDVKITEEELIKAANRWEIRHGGLSGRTARQFIDYLAGRPQE